MDFMKFPNHLPLSTMIPSTGMKFDINRLDSLKNQLRNSFYACALISKFFKKAGWAIHMGNFHRASSNGSSTETANKIKDTPIKLFD